LVWGHRPLLENGGWKDKKKEGLKEDLKWKEGRKEGRKDGRTDGRKIRLTEGKKEGF
jgi:hypothetical protein